MKKHYESKLYYVWNNMKQRCLNENTKHYRDYGGRGISVCKEWVDDFKSFETWALSSGYGNNLSIDRIDNDNGYYPDNCRWVKPNIQTRNTRLLNRNNTSGYRGVTKHKKKWQARIKVDGKMIHLGTYESKIDSARAYDGYVKLHKLEHTMNNA